MTRPCATCPYLRSSPPGIWDAVEFERLQQQDGQQFGAVFGCHANDDTLCRGWLADQKRRGAPCITLRLRLARDEPTREQFGAVDENDPDLYASIDEMVEANEGCAFPATHPKARKVATRVEGRRR